MGHSNAKRVYPNLTYAEGASLLRAAEQTIGQPHIMIELFPSRMRRDRVKRGAKRLRDALDAANNV